jgi:excisionase family DNA binding protein
MTTLNQDETNQGQIANGHNPDDYLTKEELAKRLKKTVRTIENWQRRGVLPFVKIGPCVLFYWPDVKEHLQANFRVVRRRLAKG